MNEKNKQESLSHLNEEEAARIYNERRKEIINCLQKAKKATSSRQPKQQPAVKKEMEKIQIITANSEQIIKLPSNLDLSKVTRGVYQYNDNIPRAHTLSYIQAKLSQSVANNEQNKAEISYDQSKPIYQRSHE